MDRPAHRHPFAVSCRAALAACALITGACGARAPNAAPAVEPRSPAPDLARGARLFDDWARELQVDFVPDDPRTPAADGRGGPFGDGRLADAHGTPLANDGHDYRVVRLLGADLRGAHGVGADPGGVRCEHHSVLVPSLLDDTDDAARWHARLRDGEDGIPAFGSALDARALADLVGFLMAVRSGALPSPGELFEPSAASPCGFALLPGGDASAGKQRHAAACARCHGDDGRAMALGPAGESLGSFMRARAQLGWYVILGGKAGTSMPGLAGELSSAGLRDLLAAYADPRSFPERAP